MIATGATYLLAKMFCAFWDWGPCWMAGMSGGGGDSLYDRNFDMRIDSLAPTTTEKATFPGLPLSLAPNNSLKSSEAPTRLWCLKADPDWVLFRLI